MGHQNNQQRRKAAGLGLILVLSLVCTPFAFAMKGEPNIGDEPVKNASENSKDGGEGDKGPKVTPKEPVQSVEPVAPREPVKPRE